MTLYLVRHPPVATAWQKRCYGHSDPGLSRQGKSMIPLLVAQLSALKPDTIIHSDMTRTRAIAEPLSLRLNIPSLADPLWKERDFGHWEGQTWNAIYRATGNAMDGMMTDPDHFRPGDGETTRALSIRVQKALDSLTDCGTVIIISHGGPIACAVAIRTGAHLNTLASLIPAVGSVTML